MTKDEFKRLFLEIANQAIDQARLVTSKKVPSNFVVEMHGAGMSGRLMTSDEAIEIMYIDEKTFYRFIDVGVKRICDTESLLFVRVSGHEPGTFDNTWNTPKGNGPFKVIVPLEI